MKTTAIGWFLLTGVLVAALSSSPPIGRGQETLGSISGIALSDENPDSPVRRAIVTVTGPALPASRSAVSDDEGRFSIGGLPAGSYSVVGSRATFITSAHGALRPARLGTQILVPADTAVTGIRLRLWRGAVLAGTVRNERGEPIEGLPVRAWPLKPDAARYLSLSNNGAATDEDGQFRIFGLEPGRYVLTVTPSYAGTQARSALLDAHVDAVLADLRAGGRGTVARQPQQERPQNVVYSPVYYPGTVRADDAAPIIVIPGQEVQGLDLTMIQVPAATVSGTVVMPDGTPAAGAQVRLDGEESTGRGLPPSTRRYTATADGAGAFFISHVPAGGYDVSANVRVSRPSRTKAGAMESTTLWAVDRRAMGGADVSGLVLRVGPGLTIQGRVRFANDVGVAPPGLAEARVILIPAAAAIPRTLQGAPLDPVAPDGTFTISDLKPDAAHRLVIDGFPANWWPESAVLGAVDLLDGPQTLTAGHTREALTISFSDRPATLSGTLTGEPPAGGVFIVVFPAKRDLWGSERRTRAIQPDARGHYEFVNLPPGEYLVGAIGDVDPDEWKDPMFLDRIAQISIPITLARGETRRLDLKTR
jgi:hypothetical protein